MKRGKELRITNYELRITGSRMGEGNYELRWVIGEDNYELEKLQITRVKTDNVIQQKSFAFAIRIVNAYKYLK